MSTGPLLRRINAELGGQHRGWSDVLLLKNVGPIACAQGLEGDAISNRGFNGCLLNHSHAPTHFLKVRPAAYEDFRREVDMAVHLCRSTVSRSLVPPAMSFVESSARVLVEEFVRGPLLETVIRRGAARRWPGLAAEVLVALRPLWQAIDQGLPAATPRAIDTNGLLEDLYLLESLGLHVEASRYLADRIARSRLHAIPQHGDFWPRNVIRGAAGWCVVDFETCGAVAVPLYDVFHLIRGCIEAVGEGRGDWLARWTSAGRIADALTRVVLDFAHGMDAEQIEAALAAYSVDFGARLHRRGVGRQQVAKRIRELELTADALRRKTLVALLEGSPRAR